MDQYDKLLKLDSERAIVMLLLAIGRSISRTRFESELDSLLAPYYPKQGGKADGHN